MCTLSFIPTNNGYIFTHNRDEHFLRESALAPAIYNTESGELIYPKDGRAGGTWIASDGITTICLLNGAFEKHKHQPPYQKSRGLVLLESFIYNSSAFGSTYDFTGIEPFTILRVKSLEAPLELRWDGKNVHETIRERKPMILSSATLYDEESRNKRNALFNEFLSRNPSPTPASVFIFHGLKHIGKQDHDFIMERESGVKTLSVSQVIVDLQRMQFAYADKLNHKFHWLGLSA
jgi:hypothetical protein